MARTCLFCGGTPVNREHVLPAWVSRVLKLQGAWSGGTAIGVPARPARIDNFVARILCPSCNSHFGSTLEGPVSQLLGPIIAHGDPLVLNESEQLLVSLWGAKTAACVIGAQRHQPGVPAAQLREMRAGRPPGDCLVGLARTVEPIAMIGAGRLVSRLETLPPPDPEIQPWFMVLAAGHLVIFVWGAFKAGVPLSQLPPGQFVRIWNPEAEEVHWPPLYAITAEELERLPQIGFRGER